MYQNVYYESRKNRVHIWDDKSGHVVVPYKRYAYVKDSYGTHVSLYGDKLKKLYSWKKGTSGLYESDIKYKYPLPPDKNNIQFSNNLKKNNFRNRFYQNNDYSINNSHSIPGIFKSESIFSDQGLVLIKFKISVVSVFNIKSLLLS